MKSAAQRLVDTVNATGGLISIEKGCYAPAGDEDWLDLADAYLTACEELHAPPIIDGKAKKGYLKQ